MKKNTHTDRLIRHMNGLYHIVSILHPDAAHLFLEEPEKYKIRQFFNFLTFEWGEELNRDCFVETEEKALELWDKFKNNNRFEFIKELE